MTAQPHWPGAPGGQGAEAHAPSWYAATAVGAQSRPSLDGDVTADVCIVGGGYTGLSAALHLAGHGRSVVLVEANRLGWGASGRNGGQLHSGQRRDQATLEAWFGQARARQLFDLAEEAKATVKGLIDRHAIACDWRDGLIHAMHKPRYVPEMRDEVRHLQDRYGMGGLSLLDRDELASAIGTPVYFGGVRDASAGHLHPLNYALGLARAAEDAGARLFEDSAVLSLGEGGVREVRTARGTVRARDVILACNGYLRGLEPDTEARVMPIHNYILATEPLHERAHALIPGWEAVADSRFVVHYWRLSPDGRMLFGGGESYGRGFPADLKSFVRGHMLRIYPQLADARIDFAWGGTLAVTLKRLPYLRRLRAGLYTACGYSGQGVGTATFAGKLLAEAIRGEQERFDVFAALPAPRFPGGVWLRHPTLVLAMTWYALRDRL
jgi:gamma-glutamylputrescine oxidase